MPLTLTTKCEASSGNAFYHGLRERVETGVSSGQSVARSSHIAITNFYLLFHFKTSSMEVTAIGW